MAEAVAAAVARVAPNKAKWASLPAAEKLSLLQAMLVTMKAVSPEWAQLSREVRGIRDDGPTPHLEGAGALNTYGLTGTWVNQLVRTFQGLAKSSAPPQPEAVRTCKTKSGEVVVAKVYPTNVCDKITFTGVECEVYVAPGQPLAQARTYADSMGSAGAVVGILGAGNFECPVDILTKMFLENRVAVYKANPVNAIVSDALAKAFSPLVDAGYLTFLTGGADVGAALVANEDVDELIVTGGCATYDRIMWGPPSEQAANKAANKAQYTKRFDAELGGVGPAMIVPGTWQDAEIEHVAKQIAAYKHNNSGHICASPQLIVVDKDWPQREAFMASVAKHLSEYPACPSYYPGSVERHQAFARESKNVTVCSNETRGQVFEKQVDPILVRDCSIEDKIAREEAFMLAIGEIAVSAGNDPSRYAEVATTFVNEQVFGSLCCSLFVTDSSKKVMGPAFQEMLCNLNYGSIGVNVWGAWTNVFPQMPWGAFPGHAPTDIQSGVGKVGNTLMIENVTKGVAIAPFYCQAHPSVPGSRDKKLLNRLSAYNLEPSVGKLFGVIGAAVLGV